MKINWRRQTVPIILFLLLFALGACNMPGSTAPTQDTDLLYTVAAQTVEAQMTQAAGEQPDSPPPADPAQPEEQQPEPVEPAAPTATNTPQQPTNTTEPPPATPTPSLTPTVTPCDQLSFVKDVTVPDETEFTPGEVFSKTWRLKNTGSCTWTSGYSLVFDSGDAMGASASQQLTTGTVAPGQEIDVTVDLEAPDEPGTYQGNFKLRNPGGVIFGWGEDSKSFWVKIVVPDVTGVMFDFLARADEAEWGSGAGAVDFAGPGTTTIAYGGPDDDANGFVLIKEGVKLENGSTSAKILETHPKWEDDGYIVGWYPEYTVGAGDRIQGRLGFIAKADETCGVGDATFEIHYTLEDDLGTRERLGKWDETCDGALTRIDVDLSDLKGEKVRFFLVVHANGSSSQDWAIWYSLGVMR